VRPGSRIAKRQLLAEIRALRSGPNSATVELSELKSSAIYPLLEQYRRSVERFAPAGSLRRDSYQRFVSRAARLVLPRPGTAKSPRMGIPPLRTTANPEVSIVVPVYNPLGGAHGRLPAARLPSTARRPSTR